MSRPRTTVRAGLIGAVALAGLLGGTAATAAPPPDSAGSGGHAGDWDGQPGHDILARDARTGALKVYPSVDGLAQPPVIIADGWQGYRWTGAGDFTDDGRADVMTITPSGVAEIRTNLGGPLGREILGAPEIVGYGFQTVDLVSVGDLNGDGLTDIMARKEGTNTSYAYFNLGGVNGVHTFGAPVDLITTASGVRDQVATDVDGDGTDDVLSVKTNGEVHARTVKLGGGTGSYLLRSDFAGFDAVLAADLDGDGDTDLFGRRADGVLVKFDNRGTWDPVHPGNTFGNPVPFSHGWQVNDQIS